MKLYRGFNNNYPNLGVRPEQKGIWLTDDEDFAKVYADYFKNGAIAEVELDDNANIANEYECMSVFEDDEDWQDMAEYICDLGGDTVMDNQVCNKLADCGYDGVMFDDSGVDCYYVFNRKMIKGSKIIKKVHNNSKEAMESLYEGLANKPVSFTAYHGGVEPNMTPDEGRAFYLTDSYNLALQFARREVYDDGLYVGEIPTVFTFKGTFNNPYYLTDDEYDSEGQDSNIDYEKWVEMGVDGLVYEGHTTYYIVIDLSTIKLVDKKVYWEEEEIKDDELDEQTVYAGSGVQYNNPSLDAIGSNTGDMFHGYGLYYSKNPKIAKKYRNVSNGTQWLYNGEPFLENIGKYTDGDLYWSDFEFPIVQKIQNAKTAKQMISILLKDINETIISWEGYLDTKGLKKFKKILQNIDLSKITKKDEGMEIIVDVPNDEYLLSEASFESQSPYVKKCLENMIQSEGMNLKDLKKYYPVKLTSANEGSIYQYIMSFLAGKERYELYGEEEIKYQKMASELLYKYGIKGIRYTGYNDGRCVVIFNPKDIRVIDRKGKGLNESKYTSDLFNVLLESNILTEDIAAVKKYFPKVPEEKIQTLIELDPTYQGGDNLGKFGKWILGLYNKGQLKDEDFYKVPQYLTTFKDNLKKIQNKDIMSYKTLPDLAQAIQPYEGQKDVSKKQQVKQLKSDEAEKVLETSKWLIIHPKTHKADCYYGANTKWCTASKDDDTWFNDYSEIGPLFILINKKNNEKFQFHFETLSFMDELDKPVFPSLIISNDNEVKQWFINYATENLEKIIDEYNKDNWKPIVPGGIGYGMQTDITDILNFCVRFSEGNFLLKKLILLYYEDDELEKCGTNLLSKLFELDEDFKNKCNELVAEYSPHDYFIKTYHYKTTGLITDNEFRKMLFRNMSEEVYDKLCYPMIEKINEEIIPLDEDDTMFYFSFDEEELINSLYERGDFKNCEDKLLNRGASDRFDFSELGITSYDFLKEIVIKMIKEYFEGNDDQMEFKFDESVKNWKNPFLD